MNSTDAQLINYIGQGGPVSKKAFAELYERHATKIKRFLLRKGVPESLVEDVFHETCLKIFSSAKKFENQSPLAWIYTIAWNTAKDLFRVSSRTESLTDEDESKIPSLEKDACKSDRIDLELCIKEKLLEYSLIYPERYEAVELQLDGLKINEISALLVRTNSAIKEYLSQSKKKLADFLVGCLELLPEKS